jgi:PAS domain S-box-containing protein
MDERRRLAALALAMGLVAVVVGVVAVALPYHAAFEQAEARLTETARSQARLMESVARFDAAHNQNYPGGPIAATLSQIRDAHQQYEGLGETGEFTLARRQGDQMVFLLSHRHFDRDLPRPVPFDSKWAAPMRHSLTGQSGTVVDLDYRGEMVLAAHEPVAELGMGIVAKIDLSEVRAPFVEAGMLAGLCGLLAICLGAVLFLKATSPLLHQLEQSEARYRELLRDVPVAISESTIDGKVVYLSPYAYEMLGYPPDEMGPPHVTQMYVHPQDRDKVVQDLEATGHASFEARARRRNGEVFWAQGAARVIRDRDGHAVRYCSYHVDITERKQLEQKVIHLERMRVAAELAAGVSHNLNNMLTSVLIPAETLLGVSDAPEIRVEAEAILKTGQRARNLVSRLHEAMRSRLEEPTGAVSVNKQVQQVVQKCRQRWTDEPQASGARIEVVTELAETPDIRGNSTELADLVLNLMENAMDAMPEGGTITVATAALEAVVQVTVRDAGTGMDEETRRRVFEPFFTTKAEVGSGLGLSMVHGTVTRWGGTIEVDSTPGGGSTFTLRLPAAAVGETSVGRTAHSSENG